MIYGTGEDAEFLHVERCGRPAVARTVARLSPLTETGHVRYCEPCHKTISLWGIKTEPLLPPAGPLAPPSAVAETREEEEQ